MAKKTSAKDQGAEKLSAKMNGAKKTGAKKARAKSTTSPKKAASRKVNSKAPAKKSKTKKQVLKNPKGGLTEAGRRYFQKKEGAHLKPGVTGAADTPEKMKRKGSFLRRHFANPRGPMVDDKGKPTRLALSAHAWGEAVPKTMAAAKRLAKKGEALLKRYHAKKSLSK